MKPILATIATIALLAACASQSTAAEEVTGAPAPLFSFEDEGPFPQVRYYVVNDL